MKQILSYLRRNSCTSCTRTKRLCRTVPQEPQSMKSDMAKSRHKKYSWRQNLPMR